MILCQEPDLLPMRLDFFCISCWFPLRIHLRLPKFPYPGDGVSATSFPSDERHFDISCGLTPDHSQMLTSWLSVASLFSWAVANGSSSCKLVDQLSFAPSECSFLCSRSSRELPDSSNFGTTCGPTRPLTTMPLQESVLIADLLTRLPLFMNDPIQS
jgi:hypothetical protein